MFLIILGILYLLRIPIFAKLYQYLFNTATLSGLVSAIDAQNSSIICPPVFSPNDLEILATTGAICFNVQVIVADLFKCLFFNRLNNSKTRFSSYQILNHSLIK